MLIVAVVAAGWYLADNASENLRRQNIASGFDFLDQGAGFEISEAMLTYDSRCLRVLDPADAARHPDAREITFGGAQQLVIQDPSVCSYGRALTIGFLNTIRVAALGVVLATILGVLIGIARLSSNWLLRRLGDVYVETLRNIPLLLQLFVWYGVITVSMPNPRQAIDLGAGVFLTNRGATLPWPTGGWVWTAVVLVLLAGIAAQLTIAWRARRRQEQTGEQTPTGWIGLGLIVGLPLVVLLLGGAISAEPLFSLAELRGFNFVGGGVLTPEFLALLLGLATYTASFIAETVRGGILAVAHGQKEAAAALGLRPSLVMRLVVLPQALRIIIPPTTNQYLNLTKNSSLAVAIGYPDLVNLGNTTMNQKGQAVEVVLIFMAIYLSLSLSISLFMNWYNARIALKER